MPTRMFWNSVSIDASLRSDGMRISLLSGRLPKPRQHSIEGGCEGLLCAGVIRGRSTGNDPPEAGLLHEVSNRQAFTDRLGRMLLATRVQDGDAPRNEQGG